jgi:predicted nucleotidyltransferase
VSEAPDLFLPVGTHVVSRVAVHNAAGAVICPEGAVGVIVSLPADAHHAYRVRLPDGSEVSLKRRALSIRKHAQRDDLAAIAADIAEAPDGDLARHVIYRCIVGSRAYGLDGEGSDIDRRGFYLPPADCHWSLFGVPEQLESRATEECYWELGKFLVMALKANPNILEVLHSPLVETCTPLAGELVAERQRFLSKLVFQTHNGYVLSQFKRLEQDLRTTGEIRWKHAMHMLRLLLVGIGALRDGTLPVEVSEHRERLLAVKAGQLTWEEVDAWRRELHREMEEAYARTHLPERPDYRWANEFLLRARRSAL